MNSELNQNNGDGIQNARESGQRAMSGFVWMFLGTGGQAAIQFLTLVVLARLLTPEDFGIVAAALVVVGFSMIFSQLGVGPAIVQRLDLQPGHIRAGVTMSIVLGLSLTGIVWIAAPAIAMFFHSHELIPVLRVMSLSFPLQGCGIIAESLLQREMRFRPIAVVETFALTLGYGGLGIAMAAFGFGVWALVAGHLCQYALKTVLMFLVRPHAVRPVFAKQPFLDLLRFGGGFSVARICNFLAGQGDYLVVGSWLGPATLGIYRHAYQLMVAPAMLFGQVLDRVMFSVMAKVQDQPEKLSESYRRSVSLIALLTLPASCVFVILAPEIIGVLLGPKWSAVVTPFQILAIGLVFRTSYKMSDSLVRATGAVYRRAWRQAIYAMLVVTGALVGQMWGLPGVAAGVLCALAVNFALMAQLSLSLVQSSWRSFWFAHCPGLAMATVVGLPMAGSVYLLRQWNVAPVILLICSAAAFLPAMACAFWKPKFLLGEDGQWLAGIISKKWASLFFPKSAPGIQC